MVFRIISFIIGLLACCSGMQDMMSQINAVPFTRADNCAGALSAGLSVSTSTGIIYM